MTHFLAAVLLGIVPMIVYALLIWRIDRWEKEPLPLIIAAFAWGGIPSIILALVGQIALGGVGTLEGEAQSLGNELYQASLVAPVTEEIAKALGLLGIFLFARREIDSVLDGLIYGSMIGFGFAAVENVFYFMSTPDLGSMLVLFALRTLVFGMLHAMFTGLTGVGFALGFFADARWKKILFPLAGLAAGMATHGLHNFFATMGGESILYAIGGAGIGMLWFFTTVAISLRHENRWIRIQLSDEVQHGVLFADQALHAAGFWKRSSWQAFSHGFAVTRFRKKLFHEATELAFDKQRLMRKGTVTAADEARIQRRRRTVRQLSRQDPLVVAGTMTPTRHLPPPLPPTRRQPPPLKLPPPLP